MGVLLAVVVEVSSEVPGRPRLIWRWLARHPLVVSIVLVTAVTAPGYWRQEKAIDEAHDAAIQAEEAAEKAETVAIQARETAEAVRQLLLRFEEDRAERRMQLCERDVSDRIDDRAMWEAAFTLFEGSPSVATLRVTLEQTLPRLECNAEGVPVPQEG